MKLLIKESQLKRILEILDNEEKDEFIGKKVMVYYNLHKRTFSVTYGGKVITHADYVKLKDVEFRVRQGGRERVVREKSKNVHSFVIGTLMDYCEYPCNDMISPSSDMVITYNPYKYNSFVMKDTEEPIYNANEVEMINLKDKIFKIN